MHTYLRAVGFAGITDRNELRGIITDSLVNSTSRKYTSYHDDEQIAQYDKEFAPGIGISVVGVFDAQENFSYDYYYPFLYGTRISSLDDITVEKHAEKDSYAGVCDDLKFGVSIIFYLQNMIPYIRVMNSGQLPLSGTGLSLSGLSVQGSIILPIAKDESDIQKIRKNSSARMKLIDKAKGGDEEAIDTLTMEEWDIYMSLKEKLEDSDVFTLVDTYLMPYGVECDQYSILGEIVECEQVTNQMTGQKVWKFVLSVNDLFMDVCINEQDLFGEPAVGRRFKGTIWMQGNIVHPELLW